MTPAGLLLSSRAITSAQLPSFLRLLAATRKPSLPRHRWKPSTALLVMGMGDETMEVMNPEVLTDAA
ncbi:hypothetical protein Thimo_3045 [Thioflavicoccus mobilis 8321]|uniref:Uncharacterized protein n=1 Tax=Thioflavicoccus mobilis 8321 TaxID=765912 RepID=L0H2B5_9GAMM|nr:hypothetical protein Thimo_3045 [Thioflavicoccus mobilis 8321]